MALIFPFDPLAECIDTFGFFDCVKQGKIIGTSQSYIKPHARENH